MKLPWPWAMAYLLAVLLLWFRTESTVSRAIIAVMVAVIVAGVMVGQAPEPRPPPCPRCAGPAQRLRIPPFARASVVALVYGIGFVPMGLAIAAVLLLDLSPEWVFALTTLAFAAVYAAAVITRRRVDAADSARVYRCERCHHRFEPALHATRV